MKRVLNDGFIRLVDTMGTDESVVQAARVSFGEGTKTKLDDANLIDYLMRHQHWTPFEMCIMKFHVRVPMDCWRQWIRHRTASVNEYSTRYSVAIDSCYQTNEWRLQSKDKKQGSGGIVEDEDTLVKLHAGERKIQEISQEVYKDRLNLNVAREMARKDLPLSTYTEAYWTSNLRNIFGFLKLRMDNHAQWEIRQYANAMSEYVEESFPISYRSFDNHVLNAVSFSKDEMGILEEIYNLNDPCKFEKINGLSKSRVKELISKLTR